MPLEKHMSSEATKYTVEPSGTCWKIHRNGEPITVQNAQATPMLQAATELNRLASERDAETERRIAAERDELKARRELDAAMERERELRKAWNALADICREYRESSGRAWPGDWR